MKEDQTDITAEQWAGIANKAAAAIEELIALQTGFRNEFDNMSQGEQESDRGILLSAICDIDLEDALATIDSARDAELHDSD